MSEQLPPDEERVETVEIVCELRPSAQGTYEYEREDGTIAHGDACGEWTLDESFFASPASMGYGQKPE